MVCTRSRKRIALVASTGFEITMYTSELTPCCSPRCNASLALCSRVCQQQQTWRPQYVVVKRRPVQRLRWQCQPARHQRCCRIAGTLTLLPALIQHELRGLMVSIHLCTDRKARRWSSASQRRGVHPALPDGACLQDAMPQPVMPQQVLPPCTQAGECLQKGQQKYEAGDRMGALRHFEDSLKQVSTISMQMHHATYARPFVRIAAMSVSGRRSLARQPMSTLCDHHGGLSSAHEQCPYACLHAEARQAVPLLQAVQRLC